MGASLALLASPAGLAALCAALMWPAVTGFPTWAALSRGRMASTVGVSVVVGLFVFSLVQRLTAPALP